MFSYLLGIMAITIYNQSYESTGAELLWISVVFRDELRSVFLGVLHLL